MRVLSIMGSPRGKNSNTYRIAKEVLKPLKLAGAEIESVFLSDLKINYCQGCIDCLTKGECPQKDDAKPLQEKMLKSDVLILGSPTYLLGVSAQLKTFLDRCAYLAHRPALLGKYGASVTASGGGFGGERVVEYLTHVMQMWGATVVGGVTGIAIREGEFEELKATFEQAELLGKDMLAALKGERKYLRYSEFTRLGSPYVREIIYKNRNILKADYEFWKEKGWL